MEGLNVTLSLEKILGEYIEEVDETVQVVFMQVAKEARQQLKETSPKGDHSGNHYADGWTIQNDRKTKTIHVYNKTKPGLTHLLENGHAVKNQYGSYKRYKGKKHIAPVEEWANAEAERRVMEELNR